MQTEGHTCKKTISVSEVNNAYWTINHLSWNFQFVMVEEEDLFWVIHDFQSCQKGYQDVFLRDNLLLKGRIIIRMQWYCNSPLLEAKEFG